MKNTILVITMIFGSLFSMGQEVDSTAILKSAYASGEVMTKAYISGDYDTFISYIHPNIIEMAGGKHVIKAAIEEGFGKGGKIVSNELKPAEQLIVKDTTYQCVIPQKQIINTDGQQYFTLSNLIGLSYDFGKSWTFIGVTTKSIEDIQKFAPEVSEQLRVIKQTYPTLVK